MKKDFKILKWILFPALTCGFAAGIYINNLKIFGFWGSITYGVLLLGICAIGLVMVYLTGRDSKKMEEAAEYAEMPQDNGAVQIAAFCFESVMLLALAVTLVCSIYVSRIVSGGKEGAEADLKKIEAISKLKSRTAQQNLSKSVKVDSDIAEVYSTAEYLLFWPLVGEVGVSLLGLMVVYGLTIFKKYPVIRDSQGQSPGASGGWNPGTASVTMGTQNAPFNIGSLPASPPRYAPVTNAAGVSFSFKPSGSGYGLHVRFTGSNSKHVCYLTAVEAESWSRMAFKELGTEAAKRRESRHGKDALVQAIENALV